MTVPFLLLCVAVVVLGIAGLENSIRIDSINKDMKRIASEKDMKRIASDIKGD